MTVFGSRCRSVQAHFFAWLCLMSCDVFPERATLPVGSSSGGEVNAGSSAGGSPDPAEAGAAGDIAEPNAGVGQGGGAGAGGSFIEGGVSGTAGSSASGGSAALGGGGGEACSAELRLTFVDVDTWIDEAKPASSHGDDPGLFVTGMSGAERRMLLAPTVPAKPAGVELVRATLLLNLQSNADVTRAERQLALHGLTQPLTPNRATWLNYGNGAARRWATPGGDFGQLLASATLPSGTSAGALAFDVTMAVQQVLGPEPTSLPLIIMETGAVPAAPAELAFGAAESKGSGASLKLEFCAP